MNQPRVVGMLVNHQEIDHLLTTMSDILRNHAYRYANSRYPVGHEKRDNYFDEDGTLIGYDVDTNKALLRDSLDHYVQFYRDASGFNLDFMSYLDDNFHMVAEQIANDQHALTFLTSLFINACTILGSVLCPVMEDIAHHGQTISKVESYATSFENTFYLVHGEDPDHAETYDSKEDDLSTVDCTQTEAELEAIAQRNYTRALADAAAEYVSSGELHNNKYVKLHTSMLPTGKVEHSTHGEPIPTQQYQSVSLVWNPEA